MQKPPTSLSRRQTLGSGAALGLAAAGPALAAGSSPLEGAASRCCPVVELRQYTLHLGGRDTLIELFEREFVESQEAVGIRLIGTFRDLDDPFRFVWLRGFADMAARAASLAAFYGGPVWKAHRTAANATMLDSDNVLLLKPAAPDGGFRLDGRRPAPDAPMTDRGLVAGFIHYLEPAALDPFARFFDQTMAARASAAGARLLGRLRTEPGPNSFPALPVREHETVFIWFAGFDSPDAFERFRGRFQDGADRWREAASTDVLRQLARKPEILRLAPTRRSWLNGQSV